MLHNYQTINSSRFVFFSTSSRLRVITKISTNSFLTQKAKLCWYYINTTILLVKSNEKRGYGVILPKKFSLKHKNRTLIKREGNTILSSYYNSNLTVFKKKLYHSKYYYVGLGYKVYVHNNTLFVWVGLTHYTLIKIPANIFVFGKKKRLYIISSSQISLSIFLNSIRAAKKKDIYKGKGLLEVKTYKNFIKMKTGKKKQY